MESYVLGTRRNADFKLPDDDDFHHEWRSEGLPLLILSRIQNRQADTVLFTDISFRPQIDQGSLKLLSPRNWSILDTYD